jgi:hypothetical protein
MLRDEPLRLPLVFVEEPQQPVDVGELEVVLRLFDLVLMVDVAVGDAVHPHEVEHVLATLQVHREALEPVGEFSQHRPAVEPAHLLEVGVLRDLHAVQPDFPTEAPGAERRRLPVVLDEADVVSRRIDAESIERPQIKLLQVEGRGLHHHLILVVMLQPVGVLSVTAVLRAARGLHIGRIPGFGADRAKEGGGVKRSGADLHVVGLKEHAALSVPVAIEREDDLLKGKHGRRRRIADSTGFTCRLPPAPHGPLQESLDTALCDE